MDHLRSKDSEEAAIATNGLGETASNAKRVPKKAPEPAVAEPEPGDIPEPEQNDARFTVAMVKKGVTDSRGKAINDVFFKRDAYAIYQADHEMAIQFSDESKRASVQLKLVSPLFQIRNKIQFLCSKFQRFDCYKHQVAEAFHLGVEGHIKEGTRLLQIVLEDCKEQRASFGRRCYMKAAAPTALLIFAFMLLASFALSASGLFPNPEGTPSPNLMLLATAGGAIGALLSIAIAIRRRAVELDGDPTANRLDASVRVIIGVISAGALYLILATGLFGVTFVNALETPVDNWAVALLIGIAAGFLERLVPNLLEGQQSNKSDAQEPANEATA